jgi:hypothetical protein
MSISMKKIAVIFIILFFVKIAWGQEANTSQPPDPIQSVIQTAMQSNQTLLTKHKDVQNYFNNFLPLWVNLFKKLQEAQEKASGLEDQFNRYYNALQEEIPKFDRLRAPGDFSGFQKSLVKGLNDLSDWVLDMRDRIHYATTDYQRDAYMKRLEDFQKNWYNEFFGGALEELNGNWAIFTTYYWRDNLSPQQLDTIQKNPSLNDYLSRYHSIIFNHLKNAVQYAEDARKAQDDNDDPKEFLKNIQKEVADLQNTQKMLQKLTPPPSFQDFQRMELQWLNLMEKGTQIFVQIETDLQNNVDDAKIQDLINQKNQLDQEAKTLQENLNQTYQKDLEASMKS